MKLALAAIAALPLAAGPSIDAIRVTTLDFRTALRILTSDDAPTSTVTREAGEVVIRTAARAPLDLVVPAPVEPIEEIRVEREAAAIVLRVKVAPEVPFEAMHEPGMMTVVFGEQPAPELRGPVTPELYARLFPAGSAGAAKAAGEEGLGRERGAEGLALGRVTFRPYLNAAYVDADIQAFDDPRPVRARYLQLGPGVTASMPLLQGLFAAEYEARLRFFSNLPQVKETSHFAGARLELPLGSRGMLRVGHRYTRATLETTVVDPGREYFFDLSRYTFNDTTAAARIDLGPRLSVEGEAGWRRSRFDRSTAGFLDYDSRALRAGLGYDLGGDLRAVVSYSFDSVPPAANRAIAETSAHSLVGTLSGQIGPLMSGSLSLALRDQRSPLASGESRSFRGLTLGANLRRDLGHASSLELTLGRATQLSAFETNSYYLSNSATLTLTLPLPFQLSARASLSGLRNDYPNDAEAISAPRRDQAVGFAVGLGRQLGWRTSLRADYRREKRDSNLPGYDVTTDGFVVQLAVGLGAASASRP